MSGAAQSPAPIKFLTLNAQLSWSGEHPGSTLVTAFVDSEAEENLMDNDFAKSMSVPFKVSPKPMNIQVLDGRPLGTSREE